jgi:hypothetical protein
MTRKPWPPTFEQMASGMLLRQAMPAVAPQPGTPVNGNRVNFVLTPAGTLVTGQWTPLLRANNRDVQLWQVTLAPVFRQPIGPVSQGMPVVAAETGAPRFRMTFGAGGVTFRHEGAYPVAGACFTVAATEIALDVMANDAVTVFTPASAPAVLGWITPHPSPQGITPLMAGTIGNAALVGPFTVAPFCRALWAYAATAGATVTVTFTGPLGTVTASVASGTRIPVPGGYLRYSAVASAGDASIVEELSFA